MNGNPRRRALVGLACGLAAALIWGGQISVSAYGVRATLQALDITALRVAMAGLLMLPFVLRSDPLRLCGIGWRRGLVLSLCAGAPYSLLSVGGLYFAPAAHNAVIISGLTPLLAAALAVLWLHFRPPPLHAAGLALIIVGVVCIGWQGLASRGLGDTWIGDLLFLGGALLMAGYTVALRRWGIEPLLGTAVIAVLSLLYLPIYFTTVESRIPEATLAEVLLQAVYQGVLAAVVSLVLYTRAVAALGAAYAAVFLALVPALATLIAIPALGELPAPLEWTGMLVVTAGMLLTLAPRLLAPGADRGSE